MILFRFQTLLDIRYYILLWLCQLSKASFWHSCGSGLAECCKAVTLAVTLLIALEQLSLTQASIGMAAGQLATAVPSILEEILVFFIDVRLEGMAVAGAVRRGWRPIATRFARHTLCNSRYDPVRLCTLMSGEPPPARVQRLVDVAQREGDHHLMNMVEFRKMVVLQVTLSQLRANCFHPYSVHLREIITLLVQSMRANLTEDHPLLAGCVLKN